MSGNLPPPESIPLPGYPEISRSAFKGPIHQLPNGIVVVTGFDETLGVLKNAEDSSSLIAAQGAGKPLPFEPQGSDLTAQIEAHRAQVLGGDLLAAYDDTQHSRSRALPGGYGLGKNI